jgi:transposase
MREPAKGERKALSEKAKFRLKVFGCYRNEPPRFSLTGLPDAGLGIYAETRRHFGIHRSYFYRWKERYDPKRLSSLENKPSAPKGKREPGYSREPVRAVRAVREADPSYSAKKIRPILLRVRASVPGTAALRGLTARENLFFRPGAKRHKKRSKAAKTAHERKRKPYNLKAGTAHGRLSDLT